MLDNQATQRKGEMQSTSLIPRGLNRVERKVYRDLLGLATDRAAPHIVVISDLAVDYDDLMAMIVLKELHRLGVVVLELYIANLSPADKRAQFRRSALNSLQLTRIPLAVGSAGSDAKHEVKEYEFDGCGFMAGETSFEPGERLLRPLLEAAVNKHGKITLLLLSSLMDICDFAKKHSDLLKNAVDHISIQGGMLFNGNTAKADFEAANNRFARQHAELFTEYIQDEVIRTIHIYNLLGLALRRYLTEYR